MEYLQNNKSLTTDVFTGNQKTMLDVIEEYKQNGSNISYTILDLPDNTIVPKIDNRGILGWIPSISFSESILSEIKYK